MGLKESDVDDLREIAEGLDNVLESLTSNVGELIEETCNFWTAARKKVKMEYRAAGYPWGRDEDAMWKWFKVEEVP